MQLLQCRKGKNRDNFKIDQIWWPMVFDHRHIDKDHGICDAHMVRLWLDLIFMALHLWQGCIVHGCIVHRCNKREETDGKLNSRSRMRTVLALFMIVGKWWHYINGGPKIMIPVRFTSNENGDKSKTRNHPLNKIILVLAFVQCYKLFRL